MRPNGQQATRSAPLRFISTLRTCINRTKTISHFNRSVSASGIRAIVSVYLLRFTKKLSRQRLGVDRYLIRNV
jgi:hypothetical protein